MNELKAKIMAIHTHDVSCFVNDIEKVHKGDGLWDCAIHQGGKEFHGNIGSIYADGTVTIEMLYADNINKLHIGECSITLEEK